jgi:hypothetical protein
MTVTCNNVGQQNIFKRVERQVYYQLPQFLPISLLHSIVLSFFGYCLYILENDWT